MANAIRDALNSRLTNILAEIAASQDGDSNEYVMRRYRELAMLQNILAKEDQLQTLVNDKVNGPFENITRGIT